MFFWAGLLVAGLFAWFAVRIGFYETWSMLINVVISVYLAIFLSPTISELDIIAGSAFSGTLALAVTGIGIFIALHLISFIFFTGQFNVSVARIFDVLFAGFLGFWSGLLIWSFLLLCAFLSPFSNNVALQKAGMNEYAQSKSISYVSWWCDLLNSVVASPADKQTTQSMVDKLLSKVQANREKTRNIEADTDNPDETIPTSESVSPSEAPEIETPPEPDSPPEIAESMETAPEAPQAKEDKQPNEPPKENSPPEPDSTKDDTVLEQPPEEP